MTLKEFKFQYALGSISEEDLIKIAKKTTSKYILTTLSKEKDWDIKCNVAGNPNAPVEALTTLSNDKNWTVRSYVANNPSIPIEVITKLSKDKKWYVRRCLAENPSTPADIVKVLFLD